MNQPQVRPSIAQKNKKVFVIAVTMALLVLSACSTTPQADAIQITVEVTAESTQVSTTLEATATVAPTPTETPAPKINNAEEYYEQFKDQGIGLKQIEIEGKKYSIATRDNEILLVFNQNDQLENISPDDWDPDSNPQWVNVDSQFDFYVAENGKAYIAKVDDQGQVLSFLNTIGATRDNLDQQWITVTNGYPDALWDGEEWLKEVPIQLISGDFPVTREQDYAGHVHLTKEEIAAFPTTITIDDLRNPNLGAIAKVYELGNDHWWTFGEIAGYKNGKYIGSGDGQEYDILELVVDVPISNSIIRIHKLFYVSIFGGGSLYNLNALQQGIGALNSKGIDPTAGVNRNDIQQEVPDQRLSASSTGTKQLEFEKFLNRQLVGSQFGMLIPEVAYKLVPRSIQVDGIVPNKLIQYMKNPDSKVNQKEVEEFFYEVYIIAIPVTSNP